MSTDLLIDYETFSEVSVVDCGPWRYAMDPSTGVTCVGYRWRDTLRKSGWSEVFVTLFRAGSDGLAKIIEIAATFGVNIAPPEFFFKKYAEADNIVAHNIGMERAMTRYHFKHLWDLNKPFICTSARASRMSLPRKLEKLCAALHLPHQKDMEGHRVMLQTSAPRPSWKKHGAGPKWFDDAARLARTAQYCAHDIYAECDAHDLLDMLDPREHADHAMVSFQNDIGLHVDLPLLARMKQVVEAEIAKIEPEVRRLTADPATGLPAVPKLTAIAKIKAWLETQGVMLPDLSKETVERAIGQLPDSPAKRVLQARQALGKASVSKLEAIDNYLCPDGIVRDQTSFHGAHTGRTTQQGIGLLNLPRPYKGYDQERAITALMSGDMEAVNSLNRPLEVVASSLRGLFISPPGQCFVVGDYSGVETAGLFTVARGEAMLRLLRDGGDPYCDIAALVYGRPITKEHDPIERQFGKIIILGCGYGMSADRFYQQAVSDFTVQGLPPLPRHITDAGHAAYRQKNPEVMQLWYGLEYAAKDAIAYYLGTESDRRAIAEEYTRVANGQSRGRSAPVYYNGRFGYNDIWYHVETKAGLVNLVCTLPNGNTLLYPEPALVEQTKFAKRERKYPSRTPWRDLQLTYFGKITGTSIWGRVETWGGSLAENVIQKWCREIMIDHAQQARWEVGPVVLTVYDEMLCTAPDNIVDIAEARLQKIMKQKVSWCPEMPLKAETYVAKRYRK